MRQTIHKISTLSEFLQVIGVYPETTMFRGQMDLSWEVVPRVATKFDVKGKKISKNKEKLMLRNYIRRIGPFTKYSKLNDMEWLMLAQHHGLPTRLLDWSGNPLVALYFSVDDFNEKFGDSVVYCIVPPKVVTQESITNPFSISENKYIHAMYTHIRMAYQKSYFVLYKDPFADLSNMCFKKIIVHGPDRLGIKRQLNKIGVNRMTLFPDMDNIARYTTWTFTNDH